MHSFDTNSSNVPAFLVKLWKLVEDASCNELIDWSDNGSSFIIQDQAKFAKELLPQYFKHNNMASFIRQLNMYGFRKVMNYEKSGLRSENDEMEFQHAFFRKGQGELLELIKRKIPNTKVPEPAVRSNAKDILTDLTSIREKQENMDNMLLKMKQENELLWRELTSMRQKHKAQEQIIQKVIQFLVSIVQRSNQNIGVQRKMPRMLHDSPGHKGKNSQVTTRTIDVLRKNADCFITVPQDKLVSSIGPVIHEVTDFDHDQEETQNSTLSPAVNSPVEDIQNKNDNPSDSIDPNENECPLDTSLSSPINTSVAMEPLSILEPLQPRTPVLNADEPAEEESVLGIPLEYITVPIEEVQANVISTSEDNNASNVATVSKNYTEPGSFNINPQNILIYSPFIKNDFDEHMTESLNTPQIPTIHIEDVPCPSESKQLEENKESNNSEKKHSVEDASQAKNTTQNEHNYQLAVSDSSSLMKSSTLTNERKRGTHISLNSEMGHCATVPILEKRNTLSNHLLNVEEELNWLQDHIASSSWNLDASKLLGLFSTDDVANNESLAGQIAAESNIKQEPSDIVGNELVQFTPSMLEVELDIENAPFFDCLTQDVETPANDINDDEKGLFADVLCEPADQVAASEAAEFLLSNGTVLKHNSSRRPKAPKSQKSKRRKLK